MSPGARWRANRDARKHRRPLRWLGGDTETPTVRWPLRLTGGWTGLHPGQTQVKNTQTIYLNDRTDWRFCVPLYSFRKRSAPTPLTARRPASRFGWIWGQMNINRSVWKFRLFFTDGSDGVRTIFCYGDEQPRELKLSLQTLNQSWLNVRIKAKIERLEFDSSILVVVIFPTICMQTLCLCKRFYISALLLWRSNIHKRHRGQWW